MMKLRWLAVGIWCWLQMRTPGLEPRDYSFLLSATASSSPARIVIQWPQKDVPQITVRRKLPADANWGAVIATLPGNATSFTDATVEAGKAYEYEFQALIDDYGYDQYAYGYICAGADIPAIEKRGKVLLLVDQTFSGALANELETLRKDLIGDGWIVVRHDVDRNSPPPVVKSVIKSEYDADPARLRTVFLFGHIAVPYSGLLNPDMHEDHLGAWPADVYYGNMNGAWTDSTVNKTDCEYEWNINTPGDGKFDQSTIPGTVELEVGRVDVSNLPSFGSSEQELLRNYLRKDHAFRHRAFSALPRGIIRDNFEVIDDDAPAGDAWRAFPALFGPNGYQEIASGLFFPTLANDTYLFAHGCGGGDWDKADGVGTTLDFVNDNPKAVFYLLHGSYFGDWNTEDNFLRAAIATPDYGLVSIWSSLPHWYFHPLALGETIGYAVRLTQNNRNGVYRNQSDLSLGEVHTSMHGDPTLRPFTLAPAANFKVTPLDQLTFTWDASPQAVDGYHVYMATNYDGPWARLDRRTISGTSFTASIPDGGHYIYMLRAAAKQTTGSGAFYNLSQGLFVEYDSPAQTLPEISLTTGAATGTEGGSPIVFQFTRTGSILQALSVNVQFSGTATPGVDYIVPASLTFPAGSAQATLSIVPIDDGVNEFDETVIVTLGAGAGYVPGAVVQAIGKIQGTGESRISNVTVTSGGKMTFSATGFANQNYRIEARAADSDWHTIATGTAGADGNISFIDSASATNGNLWYRAVWQ